MRRTVVGGVVLALGLASVAWAADAAVVVQDGHAAVVAGVVQEVARLTGCAVTCTEDEADPETPRVVVRGDERFRAAFVRLAEVLAVRAPCADVIELTHRAVARRIDFGVVREEARDGVVATLQAVAALERLDVRFVAEPFTCDCPHATWVVAVGAPDAVAVAVELAERLRDRREAARAQDAGQ